jgi:hypothetical protein
MHVARIIGEWLGSAATMTTWPNPERFAQFVQYCMQQMGYDNHVTAFAKALGLQPFRLWKWLRPTVAPTLDSVIHTVTSLTLTPLVALNPHIELRPPDVVPHLVREIPARTPGRRHDVEEVKQLLYTYVVSQEDPPLSVRGISRTTGITLKCLYRCEKDACAYISARYRTYLRQRSATRDERERAEIYRGVKILYEQGQKITAHYLTPLLNPPSLLRRLKMKEAFAEIRREFEGQL